MVIKQKIKPYSPTQIRKMCISMLKDVKAEYPDIENKDAAYILSEEFLSEDERIRAYFEQSKLRKDLWIETLVDYFI